MKKRYQNEKGVTLLILVVVVIIMFVVVGTLIYNTVGMVDQKELKAVYSDIEQIQQKIDSYYVQYGDLPKRDVYTGTPIPEESRNPNDNEVYYVVDLNALPNMTLNKGTNYQLDDCYIVNEQSHTVYYTKGVSLDGITYYTVPSKQNSINLPNVIAMTDDGVPIPRGFKYITGTKDTGTVIQDVENQNEFVWVPVEKSTGDSQTNVTNLKGWYGATGDDTISEEYKAMVASVYQYGGFYVGRYEAAFGKGDGINGDVSGDFSKTDFETLMGMSIPSEKIEQSSTLYNKEKGQLWNSVNYRAAYYASKNAYKNNTAVTSNLLYGVQWDSMLYWLQKGVYGENATKISDKSNKLGYDLISANSVLWGNYNNATFRYGNEKIKATNTSILIGSGSSLYTKANNIYDIAGNLAEWTQEKSDSNRIGRGGVYGYNGNNGPASYRYRYAEGIRYGDVGFRIGMYIR